MVTQDLPAKPRIIIVEDETITAQHIRLTLVRLGYEVVGVASDGPTALKLIEEKTPDLLLADVGLEGDMDGVEVANQAHARWQTPIVFLTAYSDPQTMRRARITEPYGYLVKPFAAPELQATIEIALQQKGLATSQERLAKATAQVLDRTQEELSEVTGRLFHAEEQERQRIARDLHDDIGQRIALMQIDLENLWGKLPVEVRDANALDYDAVLGRIDGLAEDLRDLSHSLHPQILDDLGLETAVEELCASFEKRYGLTPKLSTRKIPASIEGSASLSLYRIIQECLQNIAKHADAGSIDVSLVGDVSGIDLSIRDDGIGFDTSSQVAGKGLGLVSMAQRARLAGGDFKIESSSESGTCIRVHVPLANASVDAAGKTPVS